MNRTTIAILGATTGRALLMLTLASLASNLVAREGSGPTEEVRGRGREGKRHNAQASEWRTEWEHRQRTFPLTTIPAGAMQRALAQTAQAEANGATPNGFSGTAQWSSIGPAPIGKSSYAGTGGGLAAGRVAALAVDPANASHWLLGAAQGGIWETKNSGSTWSPRTDSQNSLAMGAIAFAPSSPGLVYAGTGEPNFRGDDYAGAGLLVSHNGGTTWQMLNSQFAQSSFSAVRVDPGNSSSLAVATVRGGAGVTDPASGNNPIPTAPSRGVFVSADGGAHFTQVLTGEATDLQTSPANFNQQYAGLGEIYGASPNGVYRTLNGWGSSQLISGPWTSLVTPTQMGRIALAIAASNPNVLYVAIAQKRFNYDAGLLGIWETSNAWDPTPTWTQIPNPSPSDVNYDPNVGFDQLFWYHLALLVDPTDPTSLYLGELNIWQCRFHLSWHLAAQGWDPVDLHADQHALAWVPTANNTLSLLAGNDGGVWLSAPMPINALASAGSPWQDLNTGLATLQIYKGAVDPTGNSHLSLAGCQDNGTAVYKGQNVWALVFGGDGADCTIASTQPALYWAASSQGGSIGRSLDGSHFHVVSDPITGGPPFYTQFFTHFEKSPRNDDLVIVGTSQLWRSDDFFHGVHWRQNSPIIYSGPNPVPISAMAFAPSDTTGQIYAFGTEDGQLRITSNGGATWTDLDAGNAVPNRYVSGLAFGPADPNVLHVTLSGFDESTPGQPGHLFKTANALAASPTWANVSPPVDLPNNCLVIDPNYAGTIFVGTDLGVWVSQDGAATWGHYGPSSGMPNVAVFDLRMNANGQVTAFTHGRSAFLLNYYINSTIVDSALCRNPCLTVCPECPVEDFWATIGDPVEFTLPLQNILPIDTVNLAVTLQPSAQITPLLGTQTYGVLSGQGAVVSRNFVFLATGATNGPAIAAAVPSTSPACGQTVPLVFQLQDQSNNLGTITVPFHLGTPSHPFLQDFDQAQVPLLPPGWSTTNFSLAGTWVTTTNPPPNTVPGDSDEDPMLPGPVSINASTTASSLGQSYLTSPPFSIATSQAQVYFQQAFAVANTNDGCVLEISIGNTPFQELTQAGGVLTNGNPLGARPAWSGDSGGWLPVYANLPPGAAGQQVQFRWHLAVSQALSNGFWSVDTVLVTEPLCPPQPFCVQGTGVKYLQWPNTNSYPGGLDIWNSSSMPVGANDGPWVLADDFICTNTGPITDIHLWGSWLNDQSATNTITFWLGLYDDVPKSATNAYSHPGNLLQQQTFSPGQYAEGLWGTGPESFVDPANNLIGTYIGSDTLVWEYCFYPSNFTQSGSISNARTYWLAAFAQMPPGITNAFGWKTTTNVQHDASVHELWPGFGPGFNTNWLTTAVYGTPTIQTQDLAFQINTSTNGCLGPQLFCNNLTVSCGSLWSPPIPQVIDTCCATNGQPFLGSVTTNASCPTVIEFVWVYTNCLGQAAACSSLVTLTSAPPALLCNNLTLGCTDAIPTNPPAYTDTCCPNVYVTLLSSFTNRNNCNSTITRYWQVYDACCTNYGYCTQTVSIVAAPPALLCSNLTVACGSSIPTNPPAVLNSCCSNVNVTLLSSTTVTNGCARTIYRAWQATDCCSNSAVCTQVVSVVPPVTNAIVVPNANATVYGLHGSGLTYPFNANTHYQQVYSSNQFGAMPPGGALITALAFRVAEGFPAFGPKTLPSIGISLSTTATQPDGLDSVLGNNIGGDDTTVFSGSLTLSSAGNGFGFDVLIPLSRPFHYNPALGNLLLNASNTVSGGISALDGVNAVGDSVSYTEGYPYNSGTVESSGTPGLVTEFILGPPLELVCSNLNLACGSPIPPPAYIDYCCTNVTLLAVNSQTNFTGCGKTITETWQALDCCGNTTNCTRTVTLTAGPPQLVCNPLTVQCGTPWTFTPPAVVDTCCATSAVPYLIATNVVGLGPCQTNYFGTWVATNCCGLVATCTQEVTVVDTTPPTFLSCPTNMVILSCNLSNPVTWAVAATDNCSSVSIVCTPPQGSTFRLGSTNQVQCVAKDACGNSSVCSFTIAIVRPDLGEPRIAYANHTVTITWSGGILQGADDLLGSWTDVSSVSPYSVAANLAKRFYRVRCILSPSETMMLIPAGSYLRGDYVASQGAGDYPPSTSDALPYQVYVSAFYMDTTLVTGGQWNNVRTYATTHLYTFDNAGSYKALNHPIQQIDWYDAVKWCNARSELEGLAPVYYTDAAFTTVYRNGPNISPYVKPAVNGYRLPTEAEWEKAARGGVNGLRFPWGDTIMNGPPASGGQANYSGSVGVYSYDLGPNGYNSAFNDGSLPYTSPVAAFAPNGYGLFDMAGNVSEWCWDWYSASYYAAGQIDPQGPAGPGGYRVVRGGDWYIDARFPRCAFRDDEVPSSAGAFYGNNVIGFRCVRRP
jgi:formylglycine-generating enzyme required for sulfatase activity